MRNELAKVYVYVALLHLKINSVFYLITCTPVNVINVNKINREGRFRGHDTTISDRNVKSVITLIVCSER